MSEQGISPLWRSVNSRSEGYLPIFEHNRGFSQKIRLSASTSGRDGGFARLTQLQEIAEW